MTGDVPQAPHETPEKDPQDWTTGDEPMTGPQRSYLQTLAQEAGGDVPDALTKANASHLIDRLQQQTGRCPNPTGHRTKSPLWPSWRSVLWITGAQVAVIGRSRPDARH